MVVWFMVLVVVVSKYGDSWLLVRARLNTLSAMLLNCPGKTYLRAGAMRPIYLAVPNSACKSERAFVSKADLTRKLTVNIHTHNIK